jgi:hypothetical protein
MMKIQPVSLMIHSTFKFKHSLTKQNNRDRKVGIKNQLTLLKIIKKEHLRIKKIDQSSNLIIETIQKHII